MSKSLVTESADTLCHKAEMDIKTVDTLLTLPKYPEDQNAICNFPPIKTMHDSFGKEHKYEIVGEVTAGSVNK